MIGLERFRALKGDRLTLDGTNTDVRKSELSFGHRFRAWRNGGSFEHGTAQDQAANRAFKQSFFAALTKAEGVHIAAAAVRAAGLPNDWLTHPAKLGSGKVRQVLDQAQQIRLTKVRNSEHNIGAFLRRGTAPSFADTFARVAPAGAPAQDAANPELRALFRREVRSDPLYGKRTLDAQHMDRIAQAAIRKFYAGKQAALDEAHPGLAAFAQRGYPSTPRRDVRSFAPDLKRLLDPATANGHALSTEPDSFRRMGRLALEEVASNAALLGRMAYQPDGPQGWNQLNQDLGDKFRNLQYLELAISAEQPNTAAGQHLQADLVTELRHQQALVQAKMGFVQDVMINDPLSEKAVAYSNLLWAHAAASIIDEAIQEITADPRRGPHDPAIANLYVARAKLVGTRAAAYRNARADRRTEAPSDTNRNTHPAAQGKAQATQELSNALRTAGLDAGRIETLTSKQKLSDARRLALNQNPDWAPVERDMVVTKGGVTRTYRSRITPGAQISPRFARRYASNAPLQPGGPQHPSRRGVASSEKADHYHARNLKVSELEEVPHGPPGLAPPPRNMVKVVGHGVLDMWDIEDPAERQAANERGAHEVLEAAITSNDRVSTTALARAEAGDPRPVKVTHVSVNLVTPTSLREGFMAKTLAGSKVHDYQEKTYTDAQFRAFAAHTREVAGTPTTFHLDDTRPGGTGNQDVAVDADVDVISFSFPINPLATHVETTGQAMKYGAGIGTAKGAFYGSIVPIGGTIAGGLAGGLAGAGRGLVSPGSVQDEVGGWDQVYEHNRQQMVKFVGDLGTGRTGAVGTAPGGFIGSVYDRLDPQDGAQAELMAKIRHQTDVVRELFTSEAFKNGNGDPAKMGREILTLQGLAEQALDLIGAADEAATMSKGCKSDKDRGGVTDVELKHKLITEDMGGQIVPDRRLGREDQENYYVVSAGSGQLENQTLNTGLPGSKEAAKLKQRIPSPTVRQFLAGLGKFASE